MTLEQQVCSLELAKRLKELGVKQESLFYWWDLHDEEKIYVARKGHTFNCYDKEVASAFTVAELGEMLPRHCPNHGGGLQICNTFGTGWFVGYGDHMNLHGCHVEDAKTEVDARTKMLIYLIENKLVTV